MQLHFLNPGNNKQANAVQIFFPFLSFHNDIQYIDYLKLDVQGFEPQCIDGAKNLIETKSIGVLRIEITPGNFYEKSFTLYEIEDRLSPYYQLYTVLGLHYGKKDNLLYFDAIFVKQN